LAATSGRRRADLNAHPALGRHALTSAAAHSSACLELLLGAGLSIDPRGPLAAAALATACSAGSASTERARMLLDAGVDVNALTVRGKTAAMRAALRGLEEPLAFLIDAGADLSIVSQEGMDVLSSTERERTSKVQAGQEACKAMILRALALKEAGAIREGLRGAPTPPKSLRTMRM
jgi:ankyrin repeat protein